MKRISRRTLLTQAGLVGMTAGVGIPLELSAQTPSSSADSKQSKEKIVVTGGHPGDPEYGCGGTVARLTELGHEVVLLYLNRGQWTDKPSYDPAPVRVAEATKACEILKAKPVFADQIDGKAIVDPTHYEQFHRLLETQQPDVVFTHWPIDNHADHRAISMLVYEAWLRMRKSFALFYYEVSNGEDTLQFAPSHYVDISSTAATKRQACYAHASQAPDKFYSLQEMVARMRGLERGCAQAEGFIHLAQSPEFALPRLG